MDFFDTNLQSLKSIISSTFSKIKKREEVQKSVEYYVADQFVCGLKKNTKDCSLYLMPICFYPELNTQYEDSIKKWRAGKSCLKFSEKNPLDWNLIKDILEKSQSFYA
jgi:hypothetical protein